MFEFQEKELNFITKSRRAIGDAFWNIKRELFNPKYHS